MKVFLHETGRANLAGTAGVQRCIHTGGSRSRGAAARGRSSQDRAVQTSSSDSEVCCTRRIGLKATEVHEYHSASTGRLPRLKNVIKATADGRPSGRVFLSDWVRRQFPFPLKTPYVTRDMGANPQLLSCRESTIVEFDVVYGGSISGRPGLLEAMARLSSLGARIGVAGGGDAGDVANIEALTGVSYVGKLSPARNGRLPGSRPLWTEFLPGSLPLEPPDVHQGDRVPRRWTPDHLQQLPMDSRALASSPVHLLAAGATAKSRRLDRTRQGDDQPCGAEEHLWPNVIQAVRAHRDGRRARLGRSRRTAPGHASGQAPTTAVSDFSVGFLEITGWAGQEDLVGPSRRVAR